MNTRASCAALVLLASSSIALAQTYPTRPIRIIVPSGTGGGSDVITRMVAPPLSETLRQSVVVENRSGAGGSIGVELAARAGYNPHAAISLWEKMAKLNSSGQPPKFLSTHPSNEDRIKDLRIYAEKVMPLYQAAAKGGASAGK